MTRPLTVLLVLSGLLAACGVDGEPTRPIANATIGIGSGGVHSRANVGVQRGPISVVVGL